MEEHQTLPCTLEERKKVLVSSLAFLNSVFLDPATDADFMTSTGNIVSALVYVALDLRFNKGGSRVKYACAKD